MGLSAPTPQRAKIQSKPIQLKKQDTKISIGGADTDVVDSSLSMKRKGKKATRSVMPNNSGLNMGL